MARLHRLHKKRHCARADEQFGYVRHGSPAHRKITLNMGVGEAVADKKVLEHAVGDMQKSPVKTGGDHCPQVDRRLQDS